METDGREVEVGVFPLSGDCVARMMGVGVLGRDGSGGRDTVNVPVLQAVGVAVRVVSVVRVRVGREVEVGVPPSGGDGEKGADPVGEEEVVGVEPESGDRVGVDKEVGVACPVLTPLAVAHPVEMAEVVSAGEGEKGGDWEEVPVAPTPFEGVGDPLAGAVFEGEMVEVKVKGGVKEEQGLELPPPFPFLPMDGVGGEVGVEDTLPVVLSVPKGGEGERERELVGVALPVKEPLDEREEREDGVAPFGLESVEVGLLALLTLEVNDGGEEGENTGVKLEEGVALIERV